MKFEEETLQAMRELGGIATNKQINARVKELVGPVDMLDWKFETALSWGRTTLSQRGVIRNVSRGVWEIIE